MKRTLALPLMATVLVVSACSGAVAGPAGGQVPVGTGVTPLPTDDRSGGVRPLSFAPASLQQFDDCSAFLEHVHAEGSQRVGPYGFDVGGFRGPEIFFSEAEVAATDAPASADVAMPSVGDAAVPGSGAGDGASGDGGDGGDGYSTTNVQVDGVDEPDIVKTDGERVLAITGNTLHYIDIDPGGATGVARGSLDLAGSTVSDGDLVPDVYAYGHEILISGNRAVVFATTQGYFGPMPVDVMSDAIAADPFEQGPYVGPSTRILEIDLSDPDDLAIVSTLTIDGRYVSARSVGDTARVVVTSPPRDLGFLYPSGPSTEDKAEQANRDIIASSTAGDWLPTYRLTSGDVTTSGALVECGGVHAPADFSGFDMLSIVTLDLADGLGAPVGTTAVMASGDTVYASQERLYVSTNAWAPMLDDRPQEWIDEHATTALHRFSIAGDVPARYEASGSIDGHLLNQFAMNDRDGVLYVATTTGAPWSDSSQSQIVALERTGDRLEEIGLVDGLGHGERIFSVRYVGSIAYVVTFRETDPFYVVDLGDPRAMAVRGELKIPGYSSYLHPIGDSLVLGVGQDADDRGRQTGTKVSLFDVGDPADPVEVDVWTLPDSSSDAEFDHRAFLYWAPTSTAVLPLRSYGHQFSGAVVLHVDANGIDERGHISHDDDESGPVGQTDCRVLTSDELGAGEDSELFWVGEGGGQVQLCGPHDRGGASGMSCDAIRLDELPHHVGAPVAEIDPAGVEFVEVCWPDWDGWTLGVQRSIVIGDTLWTLSPERLQANDLASLTRTDVVDVW